MTHWDKLSVDEITVLQTIFWSVGVSRYELSHRLAYSKSKTNSLVASLLDLGLLDEIGLLNSNGGRRAETLQLSSGLGVLLCVDLGATSLDLAVMKPDLTVLAQTAEPLDVRRGPGDVMSRVRLGRSSALGWAYRARSILKVVSW